MITYFLKGLLTISGLLGLFKEQPHVHGSVLQLHHKRPNDLPAQCQHPYLHLALQLCVDSVELGLGGLRLLKGTLEVLASLGADPQHLRDLLVSLHA